MHKAFQNKIAVVGLGCRFPGANTVEQFWGNLRHGKNTVSRLTPEELIKAGITQEQLKNPDYVPYRGVIDVSDVVTTEEINAQAWLLLDTTRQALTNATIPPNAVSFKRTSIFCGAIGEARNSCASDALSPMATLSGIKNLTYAKSLASLIAYQLGAQGIAVDAYTGCSTSLVLVIQAIQNLLLHQSDVAIAGAISFETPQNFGYYFEKEGILSSDGYCRAFDIKANGSVLSHGCGVVILKRLEDAVKAGDKIHAVIAGYAANNDGRLKPGFFAPGINGQHDCIKQAWQNAAIDPREVDYIEAHGSATSLGDPIEFFALSKAFQSSNLKKYQCGLGSVKTNIGHTVTASGMAALIKTALVLTHRALVPSLHFETINPHIPIEDSPFYITTEYQPFPDIKKQLVAGVSNFGFGGTNTHLVMTNYEN